MDIRRYLKAIPAYTWEVVTRYKVAWGGGSCVIVAAAIYVAITEQNLSRQAWLIVFMLAVIGAQFWHGLMQFERMRPRFEVRLPEQHFWPKENRGVSGTGYYFEAYNPSVSETIEGVKAELVSITPTPNTMDGLLPFALHIRHLDYKVADTFINPRCSCKFDLATGPDHNAVPQRIVVIPCVMGGDKGYSSMGVRLPFDRYNLIIRVSARNAPSVDVAYELWVDEHDFLRCVDKTRI